MASPSSSIDAGRDLKRRKTRKGTRSCWKCKRRKVKCTYASPTDDVCIGCARRCLNCVGQEFPEEDPGPSSKGRLVGDRIGRLESMIQQLAEQVGGHVASPSSPSAPASLSVPALPSTTRSKHQTLAQKKHQTLAQKLLSAYLSPSDLNIIGRTGETLAIYLAKEHVMPFHGLEKEVAVESERLWAAHQLDPQYTADSHPVLIARHMLLLACILQHLPAVGPERRSSSYKLLGELSQPPRALARQLAEAATTLVAAHDRFTSDTLEGLECLWLETLYHERNGSPRQSWLACRRAISTAHLVAFSGRRCTPIAPPKSILLRPDGDRANLQQVLLGLVQKELALCLVLNVPPSASCPDDSFASMAGSVIAEDDATHISKLDRRHAAIATLLIERSQRDPDFEDLDAALQIHAKLEEVATVMPSGWWHIPSLTDHPGDEADDDKHIFQTMMKLRSQIFHSYLHLLYMLQAICNELTTTPNPPRHHHNHNHSRNRLVASSRKTCVNMSRDLLRRFIHLRSCERTAGYFRLLDHYAWQAAAALLVVRLLDGGQNMTTTSLEGLENEQQRLSDRVMASEAIERMRLTGEDEDEDGGDEDMYRYLCSGAAAKCSKGELLQRLLALEAGGDAVVVTYRNPGGTFSGTSSGAPVDEDHDALVLPFPFAGHISIVPRVQRGSAELQHSLLSYPTDIPLAIFAPVEWYSSTG